MLVVSRCEWILTEEKGKLSQKLREICFKNNKPAFGVWLNLDRLVFGGRMTEWQIGDVWLNRVQRPNCAIIHMFRSAQLLHRGHRLSCSHEDSSHQKAIISCLVLNQTFLDTLCIFCHKQKRFLIINLHNQISIKMPTKRLCGVDVLMKADSFTKGAQQTPIMTSEMSGLFLSSLILIG